MHHSLHPGRRPASTTDVGESANPKVLGFMVDKENGDTVLSCAPVLASRGATVSRTLARRVCQTETIRSYVRERRVEIHSFMCPEGGHFTTPCLESPPTRKYQGSWLQSRHVRVCQLQLPEGKPFLDPQVGESIETKTFTCQPQSVQRRRFRRATSAHTPAYSRKTLTAVDNRKTMVVLNPYFFAIPYSFPPYPEQIFMFRIAAVKTTSPTEQRRVETRIVSVKNTGKKLFLHKVTQP